MAFNFHSKFLIINIIDFKFSIEILDYCTFCCEFQFLCEFPACYRFFDGILHSLRFFDGTSEIFRIFRLRTMNFCVRIVIQFLLDSRDLSNANELFFPVELSFIEFRLFLPIDSSSLFLGSRLFWMSFYFLF
jgi:hypothetical protein